MPVTITPKQLFQGLVSPDSGTDIYTAPADTIAIVHSFTIVNTDASPRNWRLYTGATSNQGRLFDGTLAAGARFVSPAGMRLVIEGNLGADVSQAGVVCITVDGAEHVTTA